MIGNRGDPFQAGDVTQGRYYASDTADPHRRHVGVTKSKYDDLLQHDQRLMFDVDESLAAGAGAFTLTVGEIHSATRRRAHAQRGRGRTGHPNRRAHDHARKIRKNRIKGLFALFAVTLAPR
ncbi:hypothetical protein [Streptomyces sp. NBC_01718]|uniref:hypothetical protein n=1 Tax=Streptomyces sp. NBC_01718 TaxID=2975919 RepID=UPI00352D0860